MRLFVAIPLDAAARSFVRDAVETLVQSGVQARWVRAENLHVTLAFLGEVLLSDAGVVRDAFKAAAQHCRAFALQLSTLSAFPNLQRPRVLYVGHDAPQVDYASTATALRGAFVSNGFRFDDDAIAHVTVGRVRDGTPINIPALRGFCEMPVRRLVLYESKPVPGSVRYDEIESVDVGNP